VTARQEAQQVLWSVVTVDMPHSDSASPRHDITLGSEGIHMTTSTPQHSPGSDFTLHARDLTKSAINGFRVAFAVGGVVALILGIILLFWPVKTVAVVAAILGINFIVIGIIRVALGIFAAGTSGGHRLLNILLGLLLVAAGIIALRNLATTAVTLLILAVVVIGIGWIVDGVLSIVESRGAQSSGWAIAYGVISILAGIAVVSVPGWSITWLILFSAIALIVIGVAGVIRGFTFGREVLKTV
jgi:uncharacterized membrane protein HdeD (DUF308 family)